MMSINSARGVFSELMSMGLRTPASPRKATSPRTRALVGAAPSLLLVLGACAGDVQPGAPLENRADESPASAADAGTADAAQADAGDADSAQADAGDAGDSAQASDAAVSCLLPVDARWLLQLTRDSGSCEDVITLDMWAADETHVRFAHAVGDGLFQQVNGECVLSYDLTFGDMRVIGYVELEDGSWFGNASGSRSVYEHSVLGGCSALYLVTEAELES